MFSRPALAFLLALAVPAGAQVVVTPAASTLLEGRIRRFQVSLASGTRLPPGDWVWTLPEGGEATLDAATGVFTAPHVDRPALVTVRATFRPFPRILAEARVLVLPQAPFDTLDQVLGPGWLEPFSEALPFLDPATGLRPGPPVRVRGLRAGCEATLPTLAAGYGIPANLAWTPRAEALGQLLAYGQGRDWTRVDVTGRASHVLTLTQRTRKLTLETLQRGAAGWLSQIQTASVNLRGLVPFAGNALAEPGHADGPGLEARFQEPWGLAAFEETGLDGRLHTGCLVADPATHVIRAVTQLGEVSTRWGVPGTAGHQDTSTSLFHRMVDQICPRPPWRPPHSVSLFHRPTFLCVTPTYDEDLPQAWTCLVADSGNHVLRILHRNGAVSTLAGSPGEAGHRDAWFPGRARFNDPRGLVQDDTGNLFVADRGNHVIRRISPAGIVDTLAGGPGQPGSRDGLGPGARFRALQGLALLRPQGGAPALYAVDGHALRRIALPEGDVTTPLGVVDTPGFQDVRAGTPPERLAALSRPCLNGPTALLALDGELFITDTGNHAVRAWNPGAATLTTVAGAPEEPGTRWGLLRDGMPVPLDERFATLDAPRGLAEDPHCRGALWVATGRCLGEMMTEALVRDALPAVALECPPARAGEPFVLRLNAETRNAMGHLTVRPMHYTVDFLEADGTLAARQRGTAWTSRPMALQGTLGQEGTASVVARCVTDQGCAAGARISLAVE